MANINLANIDPALRKDVLDVDSRFFPSGIRPGNLVEVIGASGSGKTFFITYVVARFLTKFPKKTVLLVDTRGHFSYSNLTAILQYIDPKAKPTPEENKFYDHNAVMCGYLNRLTLIKSFDCDNFLSQITATFMDKPAADVSKYFTHITSPPVKAPEVKRVRLIDRFRQLESRNEVESHASNVPAPNTLPTANSSSTSTRIPSPVEKQLLLHPELSLVIFDGLDAFTHSPAFYRSEHCRDPTKFPNIVSLIKDAVKSTKTPVMCTLIEYILPKPALVAKFNASTAAHGHRQRQNEPAGLARPDESVDPDALAAEADHFMENPEEFWGSQCSSELVSTKPPAQNIILEPKEFTQLLELTQLPSKYRPVNNDETLVKMGLGVENGNVVKIETPVQFTQIVDEPVEGGDASPGCPPARIRYGNETIVRGVMNPPRQIGSEFVATYRPLSSGRSSITGIPDHRVKFTILSNMLYVISNSN